MSQSPVSAQSQEQRVQEFVAGFQALRAEVRKVIVGHDDVINHVLTGLFAGGHVLLEGVPGLGKTLLIKTLAESLRYKPGPSVASSTGRKSSRSSATPRGRAAGLHLFLDQSQWQCLSMESQPHDFVESWRWWTMIVQCSGR